MRFISKFKKAFLLFLILSGLPLRLEAQFNFPCPVSSKTINPKTNSTLTGIVKMTLSVQFSFTGNCTIPRRTSCQYSMVGGFADKTYSNTSGTFDTAVMETGFYKGTASCRYDNGTYSASANYTILRDETPPKVSITSLFEGQEVYNEVVVKATASDTTTGNSQLFDVRFYAGDTEIGVDTESPYEARFDSRNFPNGALKITATATDTQNNKASAIVNIRVKNGGTDPGNDPVVSFDKPLKGDTISGNYTIKISVQYDGTLKKKELYVGGVLHGEIPLSSDTLVLNTTNYPDGIYTLTVNVLDSANRSGNASVVVTIRNDDSESPTVLITEPEEGRTIKGTVLVSATANDNRGVSKVQFFLDDAEIISFTEAPYKFDLDTTKSSDGQHTLKAIAFDESGASAEHAITLAFNNTAPTATPTPTATPNGPVPTQTPGGPTATPTPPVGPSTTPEATATPLTKNSNEVIFKVIAQDKRTKARLKNASITFVSGTTYKKVKADGSGVAQIVYKKGTKAAAVVRKKKYLETASKTVKLNKDTTVTVKVPPAASAAHARSR